MLERGRAKDPRVRWVPGDMRSAGLGRRFGLAVCAFNSFLCLLTPDDALAFLHNARSHLRPGGLLGIEISHFTPEELADPPGDPELAHDLVREDSEGRLERLSVTRYDATSQLMRMRLFYRLDDPGGTPRARRAHDLAIRVTHRDELLLMLRLADLRPEAVYGGFGREPFEAESDHLIVLARREPETEG